MEKVKGQSHNDKVKADLKLRAYRFSVALVKFINSLPPDRRNRCLLDQFLRAGTSIGANIVEAKSASSRKDFANFYAIALKSANETMYWLCLLRDALNVGAAKFEPLLQEAKALASILAASLLTLRGKRNLWVFRCPFDF